MESYYQNQKLPQLAMPRLPQVDLLKGQTALVTGGNTGNGCAIALALGSASAYVTNNCVTAAEEAEWL